MSCYGASERDPASGSWPGTRPPAPFPSPTSPGPVRPSSSRRGAGWPGVLALALVVLLGAAAGAQTWQVRQLSDRVADLDHRISQQQAYAQERIEALEGRAAELEQVTGEVFDPAAIAEAVLPSVFRVRAGRSTGTAFAVGGATDGDGTNLFTNYHVVQEVWDSGDDQVSLERTNQRYPATVREVDRDADIAWLQTDNSFPGLVTSVDPVRSGQPIVSVGAPLGLTDTVTTGVVSAADRTLPDGSGPWLQFDAAVNPGNSGGPVINAGKEVVGVTTEKAQDADGIGLAVPIAVACDLFDIC